jgi:hypothetical protein
MQRLLRFEVLCRILYPTEYHRRGAFHKFSDSINADIVQVEIQGSAFVAVRKFLYPVAEELLATATSIPLHAFVHSIFLEASTATVCTFHKFS